MRRITQFFLTLLFIMVGVNVVQAQTTKTLSLDFTQADKAAAGQNVTVNGTTVTLGSTESIDPSVGLVTGNNLTISKGKPKGGVKFSLSGVKANTQVTIAVTFSNNSDNKANFRYAVVKKGATSVSTSNSDGSSKTVDLSEVAKDATELDFYVGRNNSTYKNILVSAKT